MSFRTGPYDEIIFRDLTNIINLLKGLGVVADTQLLYHIHAETYTSATYVAARRYYLKCVEKTVFTW